MPIEVAPRSYGTYFFNLSRPERLAAIQYIEELSRRFPDVGTGATAGPGNEGTVYVYAPLPAEDDRNVEIHEAMADVSLDILLSTGISIALMPDSE
jgi:hypothetical protein